MIRRELFFFNDTATTEIYTLSLHDALPICATCRRTPVSGTGSDAGAKHRSVARNHSQQTEGDRGDCRQRRRAHPASLPRDRKSTRLNSSHANISYAVFCLQKKICRLLLEKL